MRFARWVFAGAGVYGLLVVLPMYFAEGAMAQAGRPLSHPELLYGFVGVTLAFQVLFLLIGRDPVRLRPAMIAGVLEKVSFGLAVWLLFLGGRVQGPVVAFAAIDLLLAVLFAIAYLRTRGS